jgi:hypothetical protein
MNNDFIYNLIVSNEKLFKKNETVYIFNSKNFNFTDNFDRIIIIDLFTNNKEEHIIDTIDICVKHLNHNGKIIFIEDLKTKQLNFVSEIKNHINYFIHFIKKDVYIDYVYELLRKKNLYIIDTDTIYNSSSFFKDTQYFSIITKIYI